MKFYKSLVAFALMTALALPSGVAFANPSQETVDSSVEINKLTVLDPDAYPYPMEQRPLSQKDIEAMEYAKGIIKEYFLKDVNIEDYIVDVMYTADYIEPEILRLPGFRNMVTVNFLSKDLDSSDGAYLTYYEDNKEIVSGSIGFGDYEGKKNFTYGQGKKIADEFIAKYADVDLSLLKNIDFSAEYAPFNYADYYYQRVENGLEYDANQIFVGVSLVDGKVINFYRAWSNDLEFPSNTPALSEAEALKVLRESIVPELRYIRTPNDEGRGSLAYVMELYKGDMVDAKTKEMFNQSLEIKVSEFNPDMRKVDEIFRNTKEYEIKGPITAQQAKEIGKEIIFENYNVELEGRIPGEIQNDEQIYIEFVDGDIEDGGTMYYIGMDLKSGQMLYLAKMDSSIIFEANGASSLKPTVNYVDAYYKAIEYLARYYPGYAKDIELSQKIYSYGDESVNPIEYSFIFQRVNEDIPFFEQAIDIRISAIDGSLMGLSNYWEENIVFDRPENLITKEAAKDAFLSGKGMKLMYIQDYIATEKAGRPVIRLGYRMIDKAEETSHYIDAKTGKYIIFPMIPVDIMPQER